MKTIYKYPLDVRQIRDDNTLDITLPANARILHVAEQQGGLCLWALIDLDETASDTVHLAVQGTGHRFEEAGTHLGSALLHHGTLVLHVFLLGTEPTV